jgi:hypothetical protein
MIHQQEDETVRPALIAHVSSTSLFSHLTTYHNSTCFNIRDVYVRYCHPTMEEYIADNQWVRGIKTE